MSEPLDRIDFRWSFATTATDERSAERWARDVFEAAPAAFWWFVLFGWLVVLRLRLGPRDAVGYVAGWSVVSNAHERIVLGVGSTMLAARLVVSVNGGRVVHETFLRYDRRRARVIWPLIAPLHRSIITYLLKRASHD